MPHKSGNVSGPVAKHGNEIALFSPKIQAKLRFCLANQDEVLKPILIRVKEMGPTAAIYHQLGPEAGAIRLVRLKSLQSTCQHPLNQNNTHRAQTVLCELEHTYLHQENDAISESHATYVALSYVWGAKHDASSIYLAGQEKQVSKNLYEALLRLRQPEHDLLLWVDQLSINQQDDDEKSRQVALMKRIFEEASEVVAWLGVEGGGSDVVITTLIKIAHLLGGNDGEVQSSEQRLLLDVAEELGLSLASEEQTVERMLGLLQEALPAFTQRAYWQRLWVVQEFVVAKKLMIVCGAQRINDVDFENAWEVLGKHLRQVCSMREPVADGSQEPSPSHLRLLGFAWRGQEQWWDAWLSVTRLTYQRLSYLQRSRSWHPLSDVLFLVMHKTLTTFAGQVQMLCADPRDRVFSLLGMASDKDRYTSFPDYKRSTESIYAELTSIFIQQGHVDVLGYCQTSPAERDGSMPSWCVDWRRKIRLPISGKIVIEASRGCKVRQECITIDEHTIQMMGFCVGCVAHHGTQWPAEQPLDGHQIVAYLDELQNIVSQSPTIPEHKKEATCAFLAAPAALAYVDSHDEMLTEYQMALEYLQDLEEMGSLSDDETAFDVNQLAAYVRELRFQMFNCPFVTNTGYIGIGPPFLRTGDLICIFPDGDAVYILRPVGKDKHTLVSGSHVQGVMNGEYFRQGRTAQTFTLV